MKKNYFLTLLLTISISFLSLGQDLIITGVYDGPLSGGTPKGVELFVLNDIADLSIYGLGSANNGGGSDGEEFEFPADNVTAGTYLYVTANADEFNTFFGFSANYDAGSAVNINGDDAIELFLNDAAVDVFGDINTDGTGEAWEHTDGWAYRKDGSTPSTTFNVNDWNFSGTDAFDGESTNASAANPFPTGTFSTQASTEPALSITSPSSGSISATNSVSVTFTTDNFNISGDNGSGQSDGSGDGFIKYTLEVVGSGTTDTNIFAATIPDVTVTPGESYVITLELVDNAGASLSPAVTDTVSFTVEFPCDIQLSTIITSCETTTSATDNYTTTIDFTGGNTGATYTITAVDSSDNAVGTVAGDDPSDTESGQIVITGVPEGIDFTVKVLGGQGSSCDFTRNISSPSCIAFPIVEAFDYADGVNLGDQNSWTKINSGDDMLIASGNLEYNGLATSTGNKVTFDEGGSETYTEFSDVTTSTVYASFLLKVTGFQTGSNVDLDDGGYIAGLAGSTSGYDARFWVRPNPDTNGTTFDIGYGHQSSEPAFTTNTYNLNDVLFVVMAYNMDTKEVSTWVNPDASSFGNTAPAATLSSTDDNPPSAINLFILRQDSNRETPFIEVDELRISDNWSDVTPNGSTASTINNGIEGFALYPNPITNQRFTLTTNSFEQKEIAIFNVLGKKVFTTSISGTKKVINLPNISRGLYLLKVTEGNKTATSKLVIK